MIQPEELRLDRVGGTLVARLSGEIDLSNAAIVRRTIAENVSNQELALVLDLSGLDHLDSAGIAMLFDLARMLARHQQRLILVVPAASLLHRTLRVSGWPANVPIVERIEDAPGTEGLDP